MIKYCYFKKTSINPLLLLCNYKSGYFSYNKISDKEITLDSIHYKYNFKIQPYNITTTININNDGSSIFYVFPEELNFIQKNYITIYFIMENPKYVNNFVLMYSDSNSYKNLSYLNCQNLEGLKKCQAYFKFYKAKL